MDHLIYTAMTGAARTLEQQAVISNNLANVATTGFRAELSAARAVPLRPAAGELPTRVAAVAVTSASLLEQGTLAETGRALDVAVRGPGWLVVRTAQGQALTRAGDLTTNALGDLVDARGLAVLSEDDAPIAIPERGSVTIADDGTLTALGAGDNPRDIQVVGRLKLVNPPPDALVRGADGLFRRADGQPAVMDEGVRVVAGFLEKSNVNPAQAMVGLIANARQFEMQMKLIQDAGTNAERANSILSMNG